MTIKQVQTNFNFDVDTKFNGYIKYSDLVALTESEINEVMQ